MRIFDRFWHQWLKRPYHLAYLEVGKGPQTVVLLHGLAANKENWLRVMEELQPDKWRVLAPDLLGFGESAKPEWNNYTVQDHARMVLAFIRRRNVQPPIVLVGHSMGCLIAAHIAATRPTLVGRLVLYEPPFLGDVPDHPDHGKRSARYKILFEYIAAHPQLAHLESKMLWRIARKISGLYLSPEEWLPFERSLRNTILQQQAYDELRAAAVPTDIVYGRLDLIVIRQGIKAMFRSNHNIRVHLVTDIHGISAHSARYLGSLLEGVRSKRKRRKLSTKSQQKRAS